MTECDHKWEPYLVFYKMGRLCHGCGVFENISRTKFRQLFGYREFVRAREMETAETIQREMNL